MPHLKGGIYAVNDPWTPVKKIIVLECELDGRLNCLCFLTLGLVIYQGQMKHLVKYVVNIVIVKRKDWFDASLCLVTCPFASMGTEIPS